MRLLYISNSRMPTEKAHGLQIVKTIEALARYGMEVTLLIPRRKNHIKTNIADFYNVKSMDRVVRIFDLVRPLQHISESLYFPLQRIWFTAVAFLYGLLWHGVIYSRNITITFLLALVGKPAIYEDHEPKNRFKKLYKFFLKRIPKKVVVARGLLEEYRAMGISEGTYIWAPNGVDVAEFDAVSRDASVWSREFGIPQETPVVLYVGHFYAWKGVYTLMDAANNIRAAVVLIGGTKEDYALVVNYAKERGISNVYLHPFVPHKEVIRFIKSADVLVLPNTATEERSQKYTTPIKLFEYMASKVPIVASNVPSFTPYLTHNQNAFLCVPDNPEALARVVNQAIDNKEIARKVAQRAYEESGRYTWEERAKKIIKFIK